mmetsp:Transcript_21229/g.35127  ORF Transcript_21229/g.35127 Transcript_21229/m.35127 type:complete len:284 (+) Transcript_21229:247-1098(+)
MMILTFSLAFMTSMYAVRSFLKFSSDESPGTLSFGRSCDRLCSNALSGLSKASKSVDRNASDKRLRVTSTSRSPKMTFAPTFCPSRTATINSSPGENPDLPNFEYMPLMAPPTAADPKAVAGLEKKPSLDEAVVVAGPSTTALLLVDDGSAKRASLEVVVNGGAVDGAALPIVDVACFAVDGFIPTRLASSSTKTASGFTSSTRVPAKSALADEMCAVPKMYTNRPVEGCFHTDTDMSHVLAVETILVVVTLVVVAAAATAGVLEPPSTDDAPRIEVAARVSH